MGLEWHIIGVIVVFLIGLVLVLKSGNKFGWVFLAGAAYWVYYLLKKYGIFGA